MRQYGQIKASGKCGELLGDDNILFPIEYDSKPIYSILNSSEHATAKQALAAYINEGLRTKGSECIKNQCSSAGACVVNPAFFEQPLTEGMPYTDVFKKNECICNQDKQGDKCEKKMDIKHNIAATQKKSKHLAWTTIPVSDGALKLSDFKDYYYNFYIKHYMNTDSNWLVFPSAYFDTKFQQSVSRFGGNVIAVEKELALKTQVVVKPSTY